jgi:hypothetical protein
MNANKNEVLMEERIKEIEEDKNLELKITQAYLDADSSQLQESSEINK